MAGLASAGATWAEGIPAPIGEEAFEVLKAFYDYDADIPLEARVVEVKDTETTVRRKVVFRSARSFLVPGYLEFPRQAQPPCVGAFLIHCFPFPQVADTTDYL